MPEAVNKKPHIRVSAGLLLRPDGQLLLAQRPQGKPWAGWWELPGGKLDAGETVLQALARELFEELGIRVTQAVRWVKYVHEYTDNIVELNFCRVTGWQGTPSGCENQALVWMDPAASTPPVSPLLPATLPPLRWLRLPERYLVTHLQNPDNTPHRLDWLSARLAGGVRLVQFREPDWPAGAGNADLRVWLEQVLALCRRWQARCLVNSCHPVQWAQQADGLHVRARDMDRQDVRRFAALCAQAVGQTTAQAAASDRLLAVSVHDGKEIQAARQLVPDFMVLGNVLPTASHPARSMLGWDGFDVLAEQAGCPVYAIGGQSLETLGKAQQHGAHGIAGIRRM